VKTIGSKRSYALTWCMPNNDDDDDDDDDDVSLSVCVCPCLSVYISVYVSRHYKTQDTLSE